MLDLNDIVIRGVHGSGWVGFVLDPDSTQNFRVGENGTRNRPEMLVELSGSGLVGFRVLSSGVRLDRR